MKEITLKACPFCGGNVNILVCDDEGNIHDAEYEKAPWSGLGYRLSHDVTDVPEGHKCPMAGFEDEGELGTYIYDTREDAAEAWNERYVNQTTMGEAIKQIRLKRGLTQKTLGLMLGFPENGADVRIAQYEANARVPKEGVIERLENVLCCRFNKVQYVEYSLEEQK